MGRLRTPTLPRPDILPEPEAGTLVWVVGDGQEFHCKPWPALVSAYDAENRPVEWPPPAAADGSRVYELNYVENPCQDPIANSSGRILAFRDNYHKVVSTDVFWKSKVPGWDKALRAALYLLAKDKDEDRATAIKFANERMQTKHYEKLLDFGPVPSFDAPQHLATKKKAPAKKKAPPPPEPSSSEEEEEESEAPAPRPAKKRKAPPPPASSSSSDEEDDDEEPVASAAAFDAAAAALTRAHAASADALTGAKETLLDAAEQLLKRARALKDGAVVGEVLGAMVELNNFAAPPPPALAAPAPPRRRKPPPKRKPPAKRPAKKAPRKPPSKKRAVVAESSSESDEPLEALKKTRKQKPAARRAVEEDESPEAAWEPTQYEEAPVRNQSVLWSALKGRGWTWKRGSGLVDFYYLRPGHEGAKLADLVEGEDYFEREALWAVADREKLWPTETVATKRRRGDEPAPARKKAAEPSSSKKRRPSAEPRDAPAMSSASAAWRKLWPRLERDGWTYRWAPQHLERLTSSSTLYVKPGARDFVLGVNAFATEADVQAHLDEPVLSLDDIVAEAEAFFPDFAEKVRNGRLDLDAATAEYAVLKQKQKHIHTTYGSKRATRHGRPSA